MPLACIDLPKGECVCAVCVCVLPSLVSLFDVISFSRLQVMMSARIRRLLEDALGLAEERERHRDGGGRNEGEPHDRDALTVDRLEGDDLASFEKVRGMGFPDGDVLR